MSAQSLAERTAIKDEPSRFRLNKSNSKHSTSSMLNNDEEDPFYDATDSSGEEVVAFRLGSSSSRAQIAINPYTARLKHLQDAAAHHLDSVNDDSLFDTPLTSRHPSEICAELNSPRLSKNTSLFSPSLTTLPAGTCQQVSDEMVSSPSSLGKEVKDETEESEQSVQESSKPQEPVKVNISHVEEDESETPLETPWTFWYDW